MADNDNNLVFTVSSDMSAAQRNLDKFIGSVGTGADQVAKKFEAVGKSIDKGVSGALQQRINAAVGIGTTASREWTGALADQGKQLDALRAKYSPLFSVITQYKTNVEDIKRAHALGAISSNEYQAAMSKERQAALASTAAIKGRNAAIAQTPLAPHGASGAQTASARPWQTGNIVAQFQDIGVGAFGGQKPLTIALQQGTQLADVIQTFGSGKSAIAGIGAAFSSLVNPVALVTIGLTAGAAALIQYFTSGKSETDKASEAIKNHTELISRIKDAWPEAAAGLRDYAAESKKILTQDLQDNIKLYKQLITDSSKTAKSSLLNIPASDFKGATFTIQQVQNAITGLDAGIKSGSPGLRQFVEQLIDIENQTGTPENIKKLIDQIRESAKAGIDAQGKLDPLVKTINGVGEAAALQAKRISDFVSAVDKLSDIAPTPLSDSDKAQKIFDDAMRGAKTEADETLANDQFNAANKRIFEQNPTVDIGNGVYVPVPAPTPRPNIEAEGLPGEVEKQEAAARKAADAAAALKKRQDDLLKSAGDRVASVQLETSLVGKYGIAADNARMSLETWQKAEKLNLNDDQKQALQAKIDQYAQLSDTLSKVKLTQDLNDKNRLAALPERDRQIVTTQRQYGLSEDPNSDTGKQIGRSIDQANTQEGIKTFLSTFEDGLVNKGESLGKSFGDAVKNAATTAMNKALDNLFSQIATGLTSLLTGNTGTAAASTAATGGLVGVATKALSSPPAAVNLAQATNPIQAGNMSAYASAIKSVESGGNYGALGPVTKSGDRAYGAYQVMGSNIPSWTKSATGTAMTPSAYLADTSAQDAVFNKQFGASVSKFGNPQDAASVWFSGRPLAKAGNASDGFNTTPEYVNKFNSALGDASKNVGTFGTGLGQIGTSLTSSASTILSPGSGSAVGAYSGLWGGIGKLFGGISPTSPLWAPNGTLGGVIGVAAKATGGHVIGPGSGTSDSIPTMLSNGEYVINAASTKKNKKLLDAINGGKVNHMAAGGLVSPTLVSAPVAPALVGKTAQGSTSGEPGVLHVHIDGANGDEHVRMLVKQGVNGGLSQYSDAQRRGGFGVMQQRYTSQKG